MQQPELGKRISELRLAKGFTQSELAEKCKQHFPKVEAFDNNKKALETALDKAKNENMPLVICGSLYLAGELRPYLLENG